MSKEYNTNPSLFYIKADKVFFENFFSISEFIDADYRGKRNIELFYTELYSSLHDYCEFMLRGLVIEKDPKDNISFEDDKKTISVNASSLIDIVKNLYGNDFFKKNPINYNNFNLLFADINSKRNADSHTAYLTNIDSVKKDLNKILNDYIICYFVLNKKKQFLVDYFLYFRKDMIDNITKEASSNYLTAVVSMIPLYIINKHLRINKLPNYFLSADLKHFIILFNNSLYNHIVFRIPAVIDKIKCPNCVSFFGEHYHDYKTLIKLSKTSDSFSCYICRKFLKLQTINCIKCSIKGIRKSYSRNNICLICNPPVYKESKTLQTLKKEDKKTKTTYSSGVIRGKSEVYLKYIEKNFYSLSKNKIGIYYYSKNIFKKIKNNEIIHDLFNAYSDSLKDNPNVLELAFSINKYKAAKRRVTSKKMKEIYQKKLITYISYYKLFYSFKNCVYIYLSKEGKNLTLRKFEVAFSSTICKRKLLDCCLRDFDNLFEEILDSIQDNDLKLYLEEHLYKSIRLVIRDNIYAGYPNIKNDLLA